MPRDFLRFFFDELLLGFRESFDVRALPLPERRALAVELLTSLFLPLLRLFLPRSASFFAPILGLFDSRRLIEVGYEILPIPLYYVGFITSSGGTFKAASSASFYRSRLRSISL